MATRRNRPGYPARFAAGLPTFALADGARFHPKGEEHGVSGEQSEPAIITSVKAIPKVAPITRGVRMDRANYRA